MVLYGDLQCAAFTKNTSFKSYGLPLLPSMLSDELSVDRRNSSELFFRRRVCTFINSSCKRLTHHYSS